MFALFEYHFIACFGAKQDWVGTGEGWLFCWACARRTLRGSKTGRKKVGALNNGAPWMSVPKIGGDFEQTPCLLFLCFFFWCVYWVRVPQLYKGRPQKKRWDFQKQTNVTILKLCCISVISGPCRARIFPPNKTKFWRYRVTHVFREWAPASPAALHSAGGHVSMGLCPAAIFRYFWMFPWYLEGKPLVPTAFVWGIGVWNILCNMSFIWLIQKVVYFYNGFSSCFDAPA